MADLTKIFENDDLKVMDFIREFGRGDLATADKDTMKSILKRKWDLLQDEPTDLDRKGLKEWKAKRGYRFEQITFKLLALEDLDPSPPYYAHLGYQGEDEPSDLKRRGRRPGGEQIDSAFTLDGNYFLLEAKWQEPMKASDMYAFRGRVDGKLTGTIGVIVSAAGFVEDAEYALLWGKEVNVLLVDGEDMGLALEPGKSFGAMMRAKLREAARIGQVFYAYADFLDKSRA